MDSHLSSTIKISDYKSFVEKQEAQKIVDFVRQRFTERYVEPMRVEKEKKNGFTIMAVSCLMIEALESFYQGWADSNRKSQLAFCNFFDRNKNFSFMQGYSEEFYKSVPVEYCTKEKPPMDGTFGAKVRFLQKSRKQ